MTKLNLKKLSSKGFSHVELIVGVVVVIVIAAVGVKVLDRGHADQNGDAYLGVVTSGNNKYAIYGAIENPVVTLSSSVAQIDAYAVLTPTNNTAKFSLKITGDKSLNTVESVNDSVAYLTETVAVPKTLSKVIDFHIDKAGTSLGKISVPLSALGNGN